MIFNANIIKDLSAIQTASALEDYGWADDRDNATQIDLYRAARAWRTTSPIWPR